MRASEQKEAERAAWRKQAASLSSSDLVFVDETGSHIAMTPKYAYAPKGQRAKGSVPRNYGKSLTLIASLSLSGMGEAFLLDGSADATAFEIYVEQLLAPSLKSGQIVILDNLSIHLSPRVRTAIEARGCRLLFLPAYSPDFSPTLVGVLQSENLFATGRCSHTRSSPGGDCDCFGSHHDN